MPGGDGPYPRKFKAVFWAYAPTSGDAILYVTANCKELGYWNPDYAFPLEKDYEAEVSIPYKTPVKGEEWNGEVLISSIDPSSLEYRYFIGRKHATSVGHAVFVKRLEGHSKARSYQPPSGDAELDEPDLFGIINNEEAHIPGYLTDHISVQFVFDPAAVKWTSQNYHKRQIRVRFEHAEPIRYTLCKRPEYRVARYFKGSHYHQFCKQSAHGPLVDSQPLIFRVDMHELEICHVRIDFFDVGAAKESTVPPKYFGYSLVSGTLLNSSHGKIVVPVRMPLQQSIKYATNCGSLTLQYLVVKALPRNQPSFFGSVHRPWQLDLHESAPVLHIGHRGYGSSYYVDECSISDICENSLASFAKAAEVGADFVEMDIMFDVDLTPIIYHDHAVLVMGKDGCLVQVAVKDLTLEMLRNDRVFHLSETDAVHRYPKSGEGSPFPTLEEALRIIDPRVGFHLEIKYPMLMVDGKSELNPTASTSYRETYTELRFPFFNKNVYVDGILHIIMGAAGSREIYFSSYDLDICALIRLKQLRYPVFLVTSNDSRKGLLYDDMRINYLKRAVYSASSFELEGVIVPTSVLFQHTWFQPLVKSLKLKVITYGEVNNSVEVIQNAVKTGCVDGVIYDRIGEFIGETKENYIYRGPVEKCVEGRQYCLGYTGYLPGRLSLVGSDSMARNREKKNCTEENMS